MYTAHSYSHAHGMNDFHKIKTAVGKFSQTVIGTIKAVKLKDVPQKLFKLTVHMQLSFYIRYSSIKMQL